jgi:hypothetical protein
MAHHCKSNLLLICMLFFSLTPYLRVYLVVNNFLTVQHSTDNWKFLYEAFILFLRRHPYCEYYYFYLFNKMTPSPLKNVLQIRGCSKIT